MHLGTCPWLYFFHHSHRLSWRPGLEGQADVTMPERWVPGRPHTCSKRRVAAQGKRPWRRGENAHAHRRGAARGEEGAGLQEMLTRRAGRRVPTGDRIT